MNKLLSKELQDALYADGREGIVIVLQAMDAAGKDSTIKHVMSGLNPQGVMVHSFKQPGAEELAHDYLWLVVQHLPPRGSIAIFNRSHYEDVLAVQILDLWKNYQMPDRVLRDSREEFFHKRYRQIRQFEEYLYENGYRVVKIFLHVSKNEQKKRFSIVSEQSINTPEDFAAVLLRYGEAQGRRISFVVTRMRLPWESILRP